MGQRTAATVRSHPPPVHSFAPSSCSGHRYVLVIAEPTPRAQETWQRGCIAACAATNVSTSTNDPCDAGTIDLLLDADELATGRLAARPWPKQFLEQPRIEGAEGGHTLVLKCRIGDANQSCQIASCTQLI